MTSQPCRLHPTMPPVLYDEFLAWAKRRGLKPATLAQEILNQATLDEVKFQSCLAYEAETGKRSSLAQNQATAEQIRLHIEQERSSRERRVEGN